MERIQSFYVTGNIEPEKFKKWCKNLKAVADKEFKEKNYSKARDLYQKFFTTAIPSSDFESENAMRRILQEYRDKVASNRAKAFELTKPKTEADIKREQELADNKSKEEKIKAVDKKIEEIKDPEKELAKLKNKINNFEVRIAEINNKIETLEKESTEKTLEGSSEKVITKNSKQMAELRALRETKQKAISKLKKKIPLLEIACLEEEIKKSEKDFDNTKSRSLNLNKRIEKEEAELGSLKHKAGSLKSEVRNLNTEISNKKKEVRKKKLEVVI